MVFLFSLIPFRILYLLSDMLYYIFYYVVKYRKKVVKQNIEICFPKKSQKEKNDLIKHFYRNFSDIILEGIKGLSCNPHKLIERYKVVNPELINIYYDKGQGILVYSQHYNNWEWGALTFGLQSKFHLVGIVKHISNPYIHKYIFDRRGGNDSTMVVTNETFKYFSNVEISDKAIFFMSDQAPYGREKSVNLDLLGINTKFHSGAAHYAHKYNLPVFNTEMRRVSRGYYELELQLLEENPASCSVDDLVIKFRDHLEKLIYKRPECWLWSHKRFKDRVKYT